MTGFARTTLASLFLVASAAALSGCDTFGGSSEAAPMQSGPDISAQVNDAQDSAQRAAAAAERAEAAADRAADAAERAERAFQLSQQK